MSYIYFGIGAQPGRVVIAAALDLSERLSQHRNTDPEFRFYRTLLTGHYWACERYLHHTYASRRLMVPPHEPWFAMEVDHAIRLWEKRESATSKIQKASPS